MSPLIGRTVLCCGNLHTVIDVYTHEGHVMLLLEDPWHSLHEINATAVVLVPPSYPAKDTKDRHSLRKWS